MYEFTHNPVFDLAANMGNVQARTAFSLGSLQQFGVSDIVFSVCV